MTAFGYGSASATGPVRDINQDRWLADGSLFAVADGLGGHQGGEVAAGIAVDELARRQELTDLDQLVDLVRAAHAAIRAEARADRALAGMCTTLCALADLTADRNEPRLGAVNVGDSRLYALTGDELEQISDDHNLVGEMIRAGQLDRAAAAVHPDRNRLTRVLGFEPEVLVDAWELRAVRGTRFLLCTDGLFSEITDAAITGVLRERDDPAAAAQTLVDEAIQAGGHDNVTAVVVDVLDGLEPDLSGLVLDARPAVSLV